MAQDFPTIFEWAGGRDAFERWLGRFYDLVEDDELLGPVFGGTVSDQHRRDVVTWWSEVMGGPAEYTAASADMSTCSPSTVGFTSPMNSGCDS